MLNVLAGMPLRYRIGAPSSGPGVVGTATVVPYNEPKCLNGETIGYCNSYDEFNSGEFPPYYEQDDVARDYDEGMIDPDGAGFKRNLDIQFALRKEQLIKFVEIDNLAAYEIEHILYALDLAWKYYGLYTIAKNPGSLDRQHDMVRYISHPSVAGIIVERGSGTPGLMQDIRVAAGQPSLPVWFVSWGAGRDWAQLQAASLETHGFVNMGVTYSGAKKEYASSTDIFRPLIASA